MAQRATGDVYSKEAYTTSTTSVRGVMCVKVMLQRMVDAKKLTVFSVHKSE
jgi:hypothetical protein